MAEFPRYNSERELTTRQPRAPIDNSGMMVDSSERFNAMRAGANQLQQQAVEWQNYVDRVQADTAKWKLKEELQNISNSAVQDPDLMTNIGKYQHMMSQAQKMAVDGANDYVKKSVAPDLGFMTQTADIGLQKVYRERVIEQDESIIKQKLQDAADAGKWEEVKEITDLAVSNMTWDKSKAKDEELKWKKRAKLNQLHIIMREDIADAEKKMEENWFGFSSAEEYSAAQGMLENKKKKIQLANQENYWVRKNNGEDITEQEVREDGTKRNIGAKFADAFIQQLRNPTPDSKTRNTEFMRLIQQNIDLTDYIDKMSPEKIMDHMGEVIQARNLGIISEADQDRVIKDLTPTINAKLRDEAGDMIYEAGVQEAQRDFFVKKRKGAYFEAAGLWVQNFVGNLKESEQAKEIQARMTRKIMDGIQEGRDIDKVYNEVIDFEQNLLMDKNLMKPDRVLADLNGREIYSDDGSDTWYYTDTKELVK